MDIRGIIIMAITAILMVLAIEINMAFADTARVTVTVEVPCNNENVYTSPRCNAPVDTLVFDDGIFSGYLTSGVEFEQKEVALGLEKMTVEDAYWYIDQYGTFNASGDAVAIIKFISRKVINVYEKLLLPKTEEVN